MKVIHFIASIDKSAGGTTTYMKLLAEELKDQTNLIVATGHSESPINMGEVEVKFFNTSLIRWFFLQKEFQYFLIQEKPHLIHINGIWTPENWLFQKVAQELGISVIISPHGMLEPWIMNRNSLKKKIALFLYQKKAIQRAMFIHATAKTEARNIKVLGFRNPISIIPNGIDLNEVKEVKTVYGTKKMVFLSRIHPKKGIELLLNAWRTIDTTDWTLEIAGNGDAQYINTLKTSAQDLHNVNFVGPVFGEAKWDFLRSATIMVLPTYSENFGIVVAEALAVGVPVITTEGTPWEELNTLNCGWYINLTALNLEKALQAAMATSKEALEVKGNNGIKLIVEKYDVRAVAQSMLQIYKDLLNKN